MDRMARLMALRTGTSLSVVALVRSRVRIIGAEVHAGGGSFFGLVLGCGRMALWCCAIVIVVGIRNLPLVF